MIRYKLFVNYYKFYLQMMEFWYCIFVYKRCKRQLHLKKSFFKHTKDSFNLKKESQLRNLFQFQKSISDSIAMHRFV